MNKYKNVSIIIILFIVCFSSTIFVYFNCNEDAYKHMYILPPIFFICYVLFLRVGIKKFKEFNIIYTGISFIRYVLLPSLIVITNRYDGRSPEFPNNSSFEIAFLLMIIEIVACSVFIFLLSKSKKFNFNMDGNKEIVAPKNKLIYITFIIFIALVCIIRPNLLKAFSFIIPNNNMLTYENFETIDQILLLSIIFGKQLFFLLICSSFYEKYLNNNKKIYIYFSGFAMLINCFIYFGYNRSDFLMNLIASLLILVYMYKKNSKKFIKVFAIFGIISLVLISQIRNYKSISKQKDYLYDITDNIQIYLAGPYDIAIAVETAYEFPEARDLKHLVFDFGRSTLGLNILFKNFDLYNSNKYFNMRLYRTDQATQIMPMIGEGYFFFGMILSPLIEILFIFIAYTLKKNMIKSMKIEIVFFFTITIIRIGFISGQNASIQMNDLSFNLFLPLILYFFNNKLFYKRKGAES